MISESYGEKEVRFSYDSLGRQDRVIKGDRVRIKLFDLLDRVIEERDEDLDGTVYRQACYVLDGHGNKKVISRGANGDVTTNIYDGLNRLVEKSDALGRKTSISYDSEGQCFRKTIVKPGGKTGVELTDGLNRLVRKQNCDHIELFSYDLCGNLETVLSDDFEVQFSYDSMNQKISEVEAGKKKTCFGYSASGLQNLIVKPDGIKIVKEYDVKKRLIALRSSDHSIDYAYFYDQRDRLIRVLDHGKLSIRRKYDPLDRVVSENFFNRFSIEREFDLYGRKTAVVFPDGKKARYSYDPYRLRAVQFDGLMHAYDAFDEECRIKRESFPGGVGEQERDYDLLGREVSRKNPFQDESYDFDDRGNVRERIFDDGRWEYSYDEYDQLTSEEGSFENTYSFDTLKNRRSKNGISLSVNKINQVEEFGDCRFVYDKNGNLIKRQRGDSVTLYSYDALNRLTEVSSSEGKESYCYGPFHRRLVANGEHFIYDEMCEIGKFSEGEIVERRVLGYGLGNEIGAAVLCEVNNETYVPIHTMDGNISKLIDLEGALQKKVSYSAFGETFERAAFPWGYQSKRIDPTGLVYFGSRYYDPGLGRFLAPDPAGFTDGYNLYTYLHNRPFVGVDPDGEFVIEIPLFITAALTSEIVIGSIVTAGVVWATATISDYVNRKMELAQAQSAGPYSSRTEIDAENERWFAETEVEWEEYKKSGFSQEAYFRKKQGSVDDTLPTDPHNDSRYEDVSHPKAKKHGHYKFKDKNTGEIVEFDKGKKGCPGHEGHDHYHRLNPKKQSDYDRYLDGNKNPVPRGSDPSHLYPKDWVWW